MKVNTEELQNQPILIMTITVSDIIGGLQHTLKCYMRTSPFIKSKEEKRTKGSHYYLNG